MKPTGRVQQITQQIARPATPGPETNPWFWNPNRVGIQFAPQWFREKLHEIDPELEVTWNRDSERWQVWMKKTSVNTPLCQGWFYLFPVQFSDGTYCPLDERTFAKIYSISAQHWGSGKQYFARVQDEMARDKERAERIEQADTADRAGDYFDYTLPKVGYGAISSSKVVGQ